MRGLCNALQGGQVKRYTANRMVRSSRFTEYWETLSERTRRNVLARIDDLMLREKQYCDKGNYRHLSNLFTALALYEELHKQGLSEDEACREVGEAMWKHEEIFSKPKMVRFSGFGFFLPFMKKFLPSMFAKGSGYGWKYTWHRDDPKDLLRFECNACIYAQILPKYGASHLGSIFCHADVINYGELQNIDFIRTETLCQTGKDCNFRFVRHPKGEKFVRTKSI